MAFRFLFRMHYKRLLFFAVFITVAFVLLRQLHLTQSAPAHERPKLRVASRRQGEPAAVIELDVDQQQQQEHDEYGTYHRLDRVGEALSRVSTCPACYGRELCSEFSEGYVTIDTAHPSMRGGRVLYSGFRHGSYQVTVTTLAESEYRAFDRVLCENAGLQENCDPASAALRSYVARPEAFTVAALRNAYKTFHTSAHTHTPQVCISDSLIRKLIAVYDENEDEKFNENEMANLYTTLITSPETAILKLLSKERSVWALPSHMGTCGRMSVVEGGLRPLADFVDERWEVRADLASQILQMIDDFQHTDNRWFFMFSELTYDHLAVTSDNRVLLTDIGDGHLIDKHGDVLHGKSLQGVCNEECFARYTRKLGGGGGEGELDVACARMPLYGHLMYAVACQEVLLPEDDAHRHQNSSAPRQRSSRAGKLELKVCCIACRRRMRGGSGSYCRSV
ncbi:PREDICTED: deleted in autism protein 1 homolog [Priapulus caudatus]|uniref:Deleted in autism protein 1 homolog n=1 Tax=Priapulus caudatus TaxID=37621 RepID=A0ABM1E6X6_PRICU|nr:PREDICTED: deleted in autism protein 1 homolog [Priapulus caudatus]XP_014667948.1 PREDICTED: deleted in autism protein 1 homolog [Priapulus caudatus]